MPEVGAADGSDAGSAGRGVGSADSYRQGPGGSWGTSASPDLPVGPGPSLHVTHGVVKVSQCPVVDREAEGPATKSRVCSCGDMGLIATLSSHGACDSKSRRSVAPFWPLQALHSHTLLTNVIKRNNIQTCLLSLAAGASLQEETEGEKGLA